MLSMKQEQKVITVELDYVNSFIIVGRKTIIVDCGNPGDHEKILSKMDRLGIKKDDVSLILITHGHVDHYGGAHELKENIGCDLAVHKEDAGAVENGTNKPIRAWGFKGRFLKNFLTEKHAKAVETDIKFEGLDLKNYGIDGKAISTPGHTPGSVSVILDSGQAIIGDLVMGGFLRSKSPNLPAFADDIKSVKKSLKIIMDHDPEIIYASHGGPFEPRSVEKYCSD